MIKPPITATSAILFQLMRVAGRSSTSSAASQRTGTSGKTRLDTYT